MKIKILQLIMPLLLAVVSITAEAQTIRVSGRISDADNGGYLSGVTIQVKGTTAGTTTDAEGKFSLEAPHNAILRVSHLGYTSKEIPVDGRNNIQIILSATTTGLDQLVVVGYGTQKKSDLTGAVSSIKGKDMDAFPVSNVVQALSGRAAGVQVMQNSGAPEGSISVRIRGTNSISGNNEPLYVVDGFPVSGSNPTMLNNSDIASIEVLKDASATAIYGSRGANGVVLITTKSGKAGATVVEYESNFGVQQLRKKLNMMDAPEYADFMNKVAANLNQPVRFSQSDIDGMGKGFDWQDFVFHKALIQSHNLTVSGGNDKTQFSTSASISGQDGIIRNSDYYRYSLRSKLVHHINKKLEVNSDIILTYAKLDNQSSSGGGRGISLIAGALNSFPTVTPYDDNGKIRDLRYVYNWNPEILNPAYFFDASSNVTKSNKVLANVALIYKPIPDLTIRIAGGIESSDDRVDSYTTLNYVNSLNSASVTRSNYTGFLNEEIITYNKTIGKHNFTVEAGYTYQNFRNSAISASGKGFLSDNFGVYNLAAAGTPGIPSSSYSYSLLLSSIARINYNFNDRFLATVNFRADGSSVFSVGNKWGYFPSGSLAWRISKEDFFKGIDWISDLKVRAGWGTTGSQAIAPYTTLNRLSSGSTGFGSGIYNYFVPGSSLPGNLKWETTKQTNVGIDLSLFNYRLQLTADYYVKNTSDLLNPVPLSLSTGYVNTIKNIGAVQNSGIELDINASIISTDQFKWDINANIAFNRNKVTKLYEGNDIYGSAYNVTLLNEPINIIRVGEPLGAFYGYRQNGYDKNGLLQYVDVNNDGAINQSDKVIIGNPNPKGIYGFNTELSYKGFDLTLFFQGLFGRDIFNLSEVNPTLDVGFGANMLRDVYYNSWTTENTNAKYPFPTTANVVRVSDRFVEDGSYLRLKNIQLAYNLPLKHLGVTNINNIQLYIGGQNLLTFTKYSWWDPEVNSQGGASSINQGIDYNTYPNYKSVNFGIRVRF